MPVDDTPVPGERFPASKIEAVRAWVTPETPVAIVDDHLVYQDYEESNQLAQMKDSTARFVQRPGPVLLIAPGQAYRSDTADRGGAVPVRPRSA